MSGKVKKLRKRCAKGDISTPANYRECIANGIIGVPNISIVVDPSRHNSKHDVNIDEVRDIMTSIFYHKQVPRFSIKNRGFLRSVVHIHISGCAHLFQQLSKDMEPPPKVLNMRITKNGEELYILPHKLLTVSLDEAVSSTINNNTESLGPKSVFSSSISAATVSGDPLLPHHNHARDGHEATYNALSTYVLNTFMMKLWRFPVASTSSTIAITEQQQEQTELQQQGGELVVKPSPSEQLAVAAAIAVDTDDDLDAKNHTCKNETSQCSKTKRSVSLREEEGEEESEITLAFKQRRADIVIPTTSVPGSPESGYLPGATAHSLSLQQAPTPLYVYEPRTYNSSNSFVTESKGLVSGVLPSATELAAIWPSTTAFPYITIDELPMDTTTGSKDTYVKKQPTDNFIRTVPLLSAEYRALYRPQDLLQNSNNTTVGIAQAENAPGSAVSLVGSLPTIFRPHLFLAIDCEMCDGSSGESVVTRISVIREDNSVLLDTLIQPSVAITNYRTEFSGITAQKLAGVSITLAQVQLALLRWVTAETILVGHSLENDLRAMHIVHSRCVDTSHMYPHPKGFPLRLKLKVLAQDYLQLNIQKSSAKAVVAAAASANGDMAIVAAATASLAEEDGEQDQEQGHDSIEDARATLQLAVLKASRGQHFGVKDPQLMRAPYVNELRALVAAANNSGSGGSSDSSNKDIGSQMILGVRTMLAWEDRTTIGMGSSTQQEQQSTTPGSLSAAAMGGGGSRVNHGHRNTLSYAMRNCVGSDHDDNSDTSSSSSSNSCTDINSTYAPCRTASQAVDATCAFLSQWGLAHATAATQCRENNRAVVGSVDAIPPLSADAYGQLLLQQSFCSLNLANFTSVAAVTSSSATTLEGDEVVTMPYKGGGDVTIVSQSYTGGGGDVNNRVEDDVSCPPTVQSVIDKVAGAMRESGCSGLLIVTSQPSLDVVLGLRNKRRMAQRNPMSAVVWGHAEEKLLKYEVAQAAVGQVLLRVVNPAATSSFPHNNADDEEDDEN